MVVNTDDNYDQAVKELMAEFEDEESDRIRLTERDILIQLREGMRNLRRDSREIKEQLAGKASSSEVQDHEDRIRVLENFRWWILGAIAVAGFLGGLLAKHLPF